MNIIKLYWSLLTLCAYLTFPLSLSTSKQTQAILDLFTQAGIHKYTCMVSSLTGTLATRKKNGCFPGCTSLLPMATHPTPYVVLIRPDRRLISKLHTVCERVCVCALLVHNHLERSMGSVCVLVCVHSYMLDIFGNLHCHLSDMTGTEPWRLYPQQKEMWSRLS